MAKMYPSQNQEQTQFNIVQVHQAMSTVGGGLCMMFGNQDRPRPFVDLE